MISFLFIIFTYDIMILGCDNLLEKSIKKSLTTLKNELQKYENSSKIANDTLAFFTYTPKLTKDIDNKIKNSENILLKNIKLINSTSASEVALLNKNLHEEIDEITNEINEKELIVNENLKKIIQHHRNSNLRIKEDIQTIETLYKEKNQESEVEYKREKGVSDKKILETRDVYHNNTTRLEKQHKRKIESINETFEEQISILKREIQNRELELGSMLQDIEARSSSYNNEKDQNYYDIKSTHSKTSIFINEKINAEKEVLKKIIDDIEKEYGVKLEPFETRFNEVDLEEEKELNARSEHYAEQLKSLNYIFDYNNEDFVQKKKDLNRRINNEITLLNTQLNETKDVYADEKSEIQKLSHSDDLDKFEKKKNRKEEDLLDRKLNKTISLVHKNIQKIQREYQVELFELEKAQLLELRDWRLKKSVYEYNYNSDREIIKLKHDYKRKQINTEKEQLEIELKYLKMIANAASTLNMLPLEASILTASSVQEREINILGSEVEYRNSHFKLLKDQLNYEFEIERSKLNLQINILQEQQQRQLKSANISTQLSIEKERIKRNYKLKEQNLKLELANLTLQFKKNQDEIDRDLALIEIEQTRNINLVNHQKNVREIKANSHIESLSDNFSIQNTKYAHQLNVNEKKFEKNELSYQEMLHFHYELIKQLNNIFYSYYKELNSLISFFNKIYLLPAHADTINLTVDTIKFIKNEIRESLCDSITIYKNQIETFFLNEIESLKTYQIDQESEMILTNITHRINANNERIDDLTKRKESRESRLNELKSIFHSHQQAQNAAIENYQNSDKTPTDLVNYRRDLRLAKRNKKKSLSVISRVESTIKTIDKRIDRFQSVVDYLNKKYTKAEQKLVASKDKEIRELDLFKNDLVSLYKNLETSTKTFNIEIEKALDNITGLYLTEREYQIKYKNLLSLFNSYHKQLINNEQMLFNKILFIYEVLLKKQHIVKDSYNRSLLLTSKKVNQINDKNIITQQKRLEDTFTNLKKAKIKITKDTLFKKNQLSTKKETESIDYKKIYSAMQAEIVRNNNNQRNSLFVMNENIKAVLKEFADEERKNINDLTKRNQAFISSTKTQVNKQIKDLKAFHTNTKNKTKAILEKESNNQKKFKVQLTTKTARTEKSIETFEARKNNDINTTNLNLLKFRDNAQSKLKQLDKSKDSFKNNEFSKMNSLYKSNLRELRKNHKFKLKALKL